MKALLLMIVANLYLFPVQGCGFIIFFISSGFMDFIVEPTFTVMSDAIDAITSFLQLQLNNNGGTGSDKILTGERHDSKHFSILYIAQKNYQIVILS